MQAQLEAITAAGCVRFPDIQIGFPSAQFSVERSASRAPWYTNGEYANEVCRQPCGSAARPLCVALEGARGGRISGTQGGGVPAHPYTLENPAAGTRTSVRVGGCCTWGSHLPIRRPHTKCATWRPTHNGRPQTPGGEHTRGVESARRGDRRLERLRLPSSEMHVWELRELCCSCDDDTMHRRTLTMQGRSNVPTRAACHGCVPNSVHTGAWALARALWASVTTVVDDSFHFDGIARLPQLAPRRLWQPCELNCAPPRLESVPHRSNHPGNNAGACHCQQWSLQYRYSYAIASALAPMRQPTPLRRTRCAHRRCPWSCWSYPARVSAGAWRPLALPPPSHSTPTPR